MTLNDDNLGKKQTKQNKKNEIYLIYFVVVVEYNNNKRGGSNFFREWMRKDEEKAWLVANNWPADRLFMYLFWLVIPRG